MSASFLISQMACYVLVRLGRIKSTVSQGKTDELTLVVSAEPFTRIRLAHSDPRRFYQNQQMASKKPNAIALAAKRLQCRLSTEKRHPLPA